jgi:hypothetical protein
MKISSGWLGSFAFATLRGASRNESQFVGLVDVDAVYEFMDHAHLNNSVAPRRALLEHEQGYRLGAHAAWMLNKGGDEIFPGKTPDFGPELERLVKLDFTFIEGCALLLALTITELVHKELSLDVTTHAEAAEKFRDVLRTVRNNNYRAPAGATALVEVMKQFAIPVELPSSPALDALPSGKLKRRINDMWLPLRLGFTFGIVPLVSALVGGLLGYQIAPVGSPSAPVPSRPGGLNTAYAGAEMPNAVARLFVYNNNDVPAAEVQSVTGKIPGKPFVATLSERLRVDIRLGLLDPNRPPDQDLQLSIGADSGLAVTAASTMVINQEHPTPGVGVEDLVVGGGFTPVALDEGDAEVVYKFELAVSPDERVFWCGYNLRVISAYIKAGSNPAAVTTLPIYVLKNC